MKTLNIKTRLTLWYLLLVVILMVFLTITSYFLLSRSINQDISLQSNLYKTETTVTNNGIIVINRLSVPVFIPLNTLDVPPVLGIDLVAYNNHQIITESHTFTYTTPTDILTIKINEDLLEAVPTGFIARLYIVPSGNVVLGNYDFYILLQGGTESLLNKFIRAVLVAGVITLGIAGIFGFFLASKALKPISDITQTANKIESNNLNQRITVSNNDEIGNLSSTLNHMFERLEKAFERERQFIADVSHELRTPLAITHGEATLTLQKTRSNQEYQKTLETIAKETSHMASIVQRLLFLAHYEQEQQLQPEVIDLSELLNEIFLDANILAEKKTIRVSAQIEKNVKINGDILKLRELFLNLLDNAVKYTPVNGEVIIALNIKNKCANVQVKDSGIGISDDQIPFVFQRFYKVDKSRSCNDGGVGLGLALSQCIARLHNGEILVESVLGEGSIFTVILPLLD